MAKTPEQRNHHTRMACTLLGCIVGLLTASPIIAAESEITWQSDYNKAAREAIRLKKPMLVEITAAWCGYCHKMKRETFSDAGIAKQINGCFIPVSIDADRDAELVEAIGVEGLPTTVIISPDLKIIRRITGYQTAAEFSVHLGAVCPVKHEETELAAKVSLADATEPVFAFDKTCLVSLQDQRKLLKGSKDITLVYKGETLCFASEELKLKFKEDPAKYWPTDNGYCPVSATREPDKKRRGAPRFAVVYRNTLWFCADKDTLVDFTENPRSFATRLSERPTEKDIIR